MCQRTAKRFETLQEYTSEMIRCQVPVKRLDETGLRIDAANHWTHVMSTAVLTALRLGESRGDVDHGVSGIVVHEDFSSYFTLQDVTHAACNVHHMRQLKTVAELDCEQWAKSMIRLLERAHWVWSYCRTNQRTVPQSLAMRLSTAWDSILDTAIEYYEAL